MSTDDDDLAVTLLAERFGLPASRSDGAVITHVESGAEFVPTLVSDLGVAVRSVSVSRPSLDDVFMAYTGRTIRDEEGAGSARPGTVEAAAMTDVIASPAVIPRPPSVTAANARAVAVVWKRELIRFLRNRIRIVTSLVQPALFLFVLGGGLSPAMASGGGPDYQTFVFPGILSMTILFTAVFSAISIVWDREFGFLREMLVAPVSRGSIVVGKCLGGATVATLQGISSSSSPGSSASPTRRSSSPSSSASWLSPLSP